MTDFAVATGSIFPGDIYTQVEPLEQEEGLESLWFNVSQCLSLPSGLSLCLLIPRLLHFIYLLLNSGQNLPSIIYSTYSFCLVGPQLSYLLTSWILHFSTSLFGCTLRMQSHAGRRPGAQNSPTASVPSSAPRYKICL
jgi:hypothetical protein